MKTVYSVRGSYPGVSFDSPPAPLFPPLAGCAARFLPEHKEQVKILSGLYMGHFFDLLGSGWVRVPPAGREETVNRSNLRESRRVRGLISPGYAPLDWHLDFKSGFRWRKDAWAGGIKLPGKPGADIKVPWELGRLQHLAALALAYGLSKGGEPGFRPHGDYMREFRDQVLDFTASNPPGRGVNWVCSMDAGIRAANLLAAYGIFRGFGAEFDDDFNRVFSGGVYAHGKFCLERPDRSHGPPTNHYLACLAGVLFAAAHLPPFSGEGKWLDFALEGLAEEMLSQFSPDGSNYEESVSYHRLSAEIMLYCLLVCVNLGEDKRKSLAEARPRGGGACSPARRAVFPPAFLERLRGAVEFTRGVMKPGGEAPQFGDNDSGRFMKIWGVYSFMTAAEAARLYKNLEGYAGLPGDAVFPDENTLHHGHIPGVARAVFGPGSFPAAPPTPETILAEALAAGGVPPPSPVAGRPEPGFNRLPGGARPEDFIGRVESECGPPSEHVFGLPGSVRGVKMLAYPDFGLYIYKSSSFYLAVRCGFPDRAHPGGHAHCDQLGVELSIGGRDIIRDPGTYLYAADAEFRDYFRSSRAHFTPSPGGGEQAEFGGVFFFRRLARPEALFFGSRMFIGKLEFPGGRRAYRFIRIEPGTVRFLDFPRGAAVTGGLYSPGYGKLIGEASP